jgi:aspartyl aminopeptidase
MSEKTAADALRESLFYTPKNGFDVCSEEDLQACDTYCDGYKTFLDKGKTEREATDLVAELAMAAGFRPYIRGTELKPGDKIFRDNRGKSITLAVIGEMSLARGTRIAAAHIDAPRLDLKQNPLYEESEQAFLKTHYYGGIRKYQWMAIPLELRGHVSLRDGGFVRVNIGGDPGDPQFTITDLLPHLSATQDKKPLSQAVPGESLNILIGSRPFKDDAGSDRVKLTVMQILNEKYGITEEDFISAELCAVPAFQARDIGIDRSMIGAYGQDDRVCAYAALKAILETEHPQKTAVCILADKEEIGSEGVTGMRSAAFDTFLSDICHGQLTPLRVCYENSQCLSADVTAAYDPKFPDVYEKRNSAKLNYGISLCKFTGSRGKSGASDASAELVARMRYLFDQNNISWQMAELGKVDQGGGGTVAMFMAERNIDTIDAGVPVLSMHAPFEVVSKLDCYMTYKAMKAFYKSI